MPSVRRGLACAECPLWDYQLPYSNDASQQAISASARAVAFHAGAEGGEPAIDPLLNDAAKACAQIILENHCTQWVFLGEGSGFVFRDGRHHPIGT
jgi:hypothetical protein